MEGKGPEPAATAGTMGFFDHLDELRVRVMRALTIFFVGFLICFFLTNPFVLEFLRAPLFDIFPPEQQKLYFTGLFENFLTHLKIAGYSSLFFFSPFFFYQVWAFVAPGLYGREKKMMVPFVAAATVFFLAGAAFAYYVLFPVGFRFFVTYGLESDTPILTIDAYYGTCLKLLLLFGLAFELPVLICLLGFLGVIDAKFLRKNRRNAILGITVVSAMVAPPDAISMILLMIPLILLYEMAIGVVHWFGVKRHARVADGVPAESPEDPKDPDEPWTGFGNA